MSMINETEESGDAQLVAALSQALGDRYRFVSRLGAGAFGEVYCLHDSTLERDVAVKRVRLDAFAEAAQRNELRERTIREAKVAAKLKHPYIVTIYDVVDRPDMSFIIMEYIEGRTLGQLLKETGRQSLEETVRLLGQTASALDFAHEKGVFHRDIKPANIMVESASGNVKVMDFGIAKSDSFTELTAAGSVLGTPNYMSPEQARGEPNIDKRADLFSLGCVLYECVVGQKAFVGKNVMATLMSIMNDRPRPFDAEALGLHPDVTEIMKRALAKDPSRALRKRQGAHRGFSRHPSDSSNPRSSSLRRSPRHRRWSSPGGRRGTRPRSTQESKGALPIPRWPRSSERSTAPATQASCISNRTASPSASTSRRETSCSRTRTSTTTAWESS